MTATITLNAEYTATVETTHYGADRPVIVLLRNGRRTPGQWFAETLCSRPASGPLYIDSGANWKIDAAAHKELRAFAAEVLFAIESCGDCGELMNLHLTQDELDARGLDTRDGNGCFIIARR